MQPLPMTVGGSFEGAARLASPSPREAAISGGGDRTIDIDLGTPMAVDTIFAGYTNATDGYLGLSYGVTDYTSVPLAGINLAPSRLVGRRRHFFTCLAQPITAQYIRLGAPATPAGYSIGVVAVGLSIRPALGHEWGSGRFVVDTGSTTRLAGGGFGLFRGARAGGWQWTLADLDQAGADAIYGLQLGVGTTSTILVAEDPDMSPGLNERLHWGVLTKLDPSERRDVDDIKWDMRMEDWA